MFCQSIRHLVTDQMSTGKYKIHKNKIQHPKIQIQNPQSQIQHPKVVVFVTLSKARVKGGVPIIKMEI